MKNPDMIIGIDPGANGGIAYWKNGTVKVVKMPRELEDLSKFLDYILSISERPLVFMEKVQIRMDDSSEENRGKQFRIQKMMEGYERLKITMSMKEIPFILVHPMSWQSYLKLRDAMNKESKTERKTRYVGVAGRLYPMVKTTKWSADALLLVEFGRRKLANDQNWIMAQLPKRVQETFNF